ncbi:MAG TPA: hypothetical protein VF523_03250, partial [Burkholderiales bacterium]
SAARADQRSGQSDQDLRACSDRPRHQTMDRSFGGRLTALATALGRNQTSLGTAAQPDPAMMFWHEYINGTCLMAPLAE